MRWPSLAKMVLHGGLPFWSVHLKHVKHAVKYFTSDSCGVDGIFQSVIGNILLTIGPHMVNLNFS